MKKTFITSIALFVAVLAFGQPVLRNFDTTNTTAVVFAHETASAVAAIVADVTKQPASIALTNLVSGIGTGLTNVQPISANLFLLSSNNAAGLTNVQPSGIAGPLFTGRVTNVSTLSTNVEFFSFGILTNVTRNP